LELKCSGEERLGEDGRKIRGKQISFFFHLRGEKKTEMWKHPTKDKEMEKVG